MCEADKKLKIDKMMKFLGIDEVRCTSLIAPINKGKYGFVHDYIDYDKLNGTAYLDSDGKYTIIDIECDNVINSVYRNLAERCKKALVQQAYENYATSVLGFIP